jgi:glutathione S-transferase
MKLYNMNLSNFATKSRIAIYDKGLNIEIAAIPGNNLKSPEYLKINPLGKTPALDADGTIVAESEIINEYLEDKFPSPPLLPKTPEGRARVRAFTRFHDLYLEPPLRALFGQLNPKSRDEKIVNQRQTEFNQRLDQLEAMLSPSGFASARVHTGRLRARADDVLRDRHVAGLRRQAGAGRAPQAGGVVEARPDASVGEQSARRDGRGARGHDEALVFHQPSRRASDAGANAAIGCGVR